MSKPDQAILRMYNALMAIGALDDSLHSHMWCYFRTKQIVDACLSEMNVEHTQLIQHALGIGVRRRLRRETECQKKK